MQWTKPWYVPWHEHNTGLDSVPSMAWSLGQKLNSGTYATSIIPWSGIAGLLVSERNHTKTKGSIHGLRVNSDNQFLLLNNNFCQMHADSDAVVWQNKQWKSNGKKVNNLSDDSPLAAGWLHAGCRWRTAGKWWDLNTTNNLPPKTHQPFTTRICISASSLVSGSGQMVCVRSSRV